MFLMINLCVAPKNIAASKRKKIKRKDLDNFMWNDRVKEKEIIEKKNIIFKH